MFKGKEKVAPAGEDGRLGSASVGEDECCVLDIRWGADAEVSENQDTPVPIGQVTPVPPRPQ